MIPNLEETIEDPFVDEEKSQPNGQSFWLKKSFKLIKIGPLVSWARST